MISAELKPCPFCGGKAEPDTDDLGCHSIRCMDCTIVLGAYSTARSAAANWNHRAQGLSQEDREACLAGAKALYELAMANDCCREHDDQVKWNNAAILRRLGGQTT